MGGFFYSVHLKMIFLGGGIYSMARLFIHLYAGGFSKLIDLWIGSNLNLFHRNPENRFYFAWLDMYVDIFKRIGSNASLVGKVKYIMTNQVFCETSPSYGFRIRVRVRVRFLPDKGKGEIGPGLVVDSFAG